MLNDLDKFDVQLVVLRDAIEILLAFQWAGLTRAESERNKSMFLERASDPPAQPSESWMDNAEFYQAKRAYQIEFTKQFLAGITRKEESVRRHLDSSAAAGGLQ